MTIPKRSAELNTRPEDFNIPKDTSDQYFRQITKVGPGLSNLSQHGFSEKSDNEDVNEFSYPKYEQHPIFNDSKENYLKTPQAQWWKSLRGRMNESYDKGERGGDKWQKHTDDSHHNGHWAVHMDNKTDVMNAYDDYLDRRHFAEQKLMKMVLPSNEEVDGIKSARENVDAKYQKMHNHLHETCFRSDAKGGPCGYWGIPRGRDNCEYCKAGNPVRLIGDPKRIASTQDDWAVNGEEPKSTLPKVKKEIGKEMGDTSHHPEFDTEPFNKPVEVPKDIVSQIPKTPEGSEAAYSPKGQALPGNRMISIGDPALEHHMSHIATHGQLYGTAALAYDDYLNKRNHHDNMEDIAGPHPDERQQKILDSHKSELSDLHDNAHQAWHDMHDYKHSDCPECNNWNHPRGKENCEQCKTGCPMCPKDDPKRLSSITNWMI